MASVDQLVRAATRENTRQSYRSAIRHFEEEWGGFLPASADAVARYLADHAESHALNTLRQRLSALARWHQTQGFPDPTKTPLVRQVLKGIRELHPSREKQAKPLQIDQLDRLVSWLDGQIHQATDTADLPAQRRHSRDRALVLMGFWRGFRSDELCRLRIEDIQHEPGVGLRIYLPRTKTSRGYAGVEFQLPELERLCPVKAYLDWISLAQATEGPVFPRITRWGEIGNAALHPDSIVPILRRCFVGAGLPAPDSYSGHSLRRGFATWANTNGWDLHSLMHYVGWRDVRSAMRYIDQGRATLRPPHATEPAALPAPRTNALDVFMAVESYRTARSNAGATRKYLERCYLTPYAMEKLEENGHYRIHIEYRDDESLEEFVYELIGNLHAAASDRQCFVDVRIRDVINKITWE